MWPTPTVNGNYNRKEASKTSGDGLATAVRMWPTPKASDAVIGMTARTSQRTIEKSTHLNTQVYLAEKAKMWPTPNARDHKGKTTWENQPCLPNAAGGQLNPEWVEILQGFPPGWLDIDGPLPTDANSTNGSRRG
jgi:hypothetical protein